MTARRAFAALSERLLAWFDAWFGSAAGVYQTLAATSTVVVVELVFPDLDPHGFVVLYLLTVYSAVTQPALAHTGHVSSARLEQLERRQIAVLETLHALTAEQNAVLAEVRASGARIEDRLGTVAP